MNITLIPSKKTQKPNPKKQIFKSGLTLTHIPKSKHIQHQKNKQESTKTQYKQNNHTKQQQNTQQSSYFYTCCKQNSKQQLQIETVMPKKYLSPKKQLQIDLQIIYLPTDFSLLKSQQKQIQSSSKQYNGSIWNIDSPVNQLY